MDIKQPQRSSYPPPPPSPGVPQPEGENLFAQLLRRFRESSAFPVFSIAVVFVIILGLGFAVVGLVKRVTEGETFKGAPESQNISYRISGTAELHLAVLRAAYREVYEDTRPLAEGRRFAVITLEIRNEGDATASPLTREDLRLIAPDGSILPPSRFTPGFLNTAIRAGEKRQGDVIWDIDPRNSQRPLAEFQIAFGKSPGSRALYPVTHETR